LQWPNGCGGNGEDNLGRERDPFGRVFSSLLGITRATPSIFDPQIAADASDAISGVVVNSVGSSAAATSFGSLCPLL
jgi:hypothetical protein